MYDFHRISVSKDDRKYRPAECGHRNIKLDARGGIVTCVDCNVALTPFWALTMLAEQYAVSLKSIDTLQERVALANRRVADLSEQLDSARAQIAEASSKPADI